MAVGKLNVQVIPSTKTAHKNDVVFKREVWNEFVRGANLGSVRLGRYYLESASEGLSGANFWEVGLTSKDLSKLLTNLFVDAVEVGAIVLPAPYGFEDFVFEAGIRQTSADQNSV